jgi:hypothetical protein
MSYYSPGTQNPGAGIRVGYTPGPWTARQDHAVVTDNYSVGGSNALRIRNWDTVEVRGNISASKQNSEALLLGGGVYLL